MRGDIKTGACPASGLAKCLCRAEVSPDSVLRFSEPTSRTRSTGALKTVLFLFAIIIALFVAGGCAEVQIPPRDQSASQFNVYFNNDNLTDGMTVCNAVFPVTRSSPSTTNGAASALEALFLGPTPEERSQGYRSFFSGRTAGLLKRLKTEAGTAYIDLHDKRREFSGVTSSCGSAEFFSQIQRTLEEFPTIDRIIFAIEGSPRVFYDWMELECDLTNDNCAPGSFAPP
jgi:hypothetical protein